MLPQPPTDWRDVPGWDRYWQATLDGDSKSLWYDMHPIAGFLWVRNLRETLLASGQTRLLFIGNGVSLTPHAFAVAGFTTVALDVSQVASGYLQRLAVEKDHLLYFFQDGDAPASELLEASLRSGGSVDVVCGDLFDSEVAQGPYDVVFSERSLQGFSSYDLELAVGAIDARLRRPGECHVLVQNSSESLARIVSVFERHGLLDCPLGEPAPSSAEKVVYAAVGSG